MDEYIKREDALDAVLFALMGTGYQSRAIQAVRDVPTADVAPRAEVDKARLEGFEQGKRDNVYGFSAKELAAKIERLSVDLEAMRMAANSYKIHYEKVKSEVAREIFEEIEQRINFEKNRWHEYWEKSGDQNAIIRMQTCILIMYHLEAVKEKYTEGKYENQN